jgi:hypothetical protein
VQRTAICPACGLTCTAGDEALAEKRASCPADGEFELTPARVTSLAGSTPAGLVIRADDDRRLSIARRRLSPLGAIGIGIMAATSLLNLLEGERPRGPLLTLAFAAVAIVLTSMPTVLAGRRWVWAGGIPLRLDRIDRFTTEQVGEHARLVAHLQGGRRRRLGPHLPPEQADYVRRRLEDRLR